MLIRLNPSDLRPIYVQIKDEIRRGVATGALRPDDPLPSVRQLASTLRVNPNTVAQAYRELESEGWVYVLRGQGTFVRAASGADEARSELVSAFARRVLVEGRRLGLATEQIIDAVRGAEPDEAGEDDDAG